MDVMRCWTQVHYYHYGVVAVWGLVATVTLSSPGTHAIVLGPLRLDAFWLSILAVGALLVLSVVDTYDLTDHGLEPPDQDECRAKIRSARGRHDSNARLSERLAFPAAA